MTGVCEERRGHGRPQWSEGAGPRNSLSVQWLGLQAFTAKSLGSSPGWGIKILQTAQCSQKNKKEQGVTPCSVLTSPVGHSLSSSLATLSTSLATLELPGNKISLICSSIHLFL